MNRYKEYEVRWKKKHDLLLALSITTLIICGVYCAWQGIKHIIGLT